LHKIINISSKSRISKISSKSSKISKISSKSSKISKISSKSSKISNFSSTSRISNPAKNEINNWNKE
jgi:hypothetical protein